MVYIWLMIIIFLALMEFMTVNLTTIWFVISGIVAVVLAYFQVHIVLQFAVFVIGGVILLIATRAFVKKFVKPRDIPTNLDRIIGERGIVTEEIVLDQIGEVKVDGKKWSAVAKTDIKMGSTVKILSIHGVKLEVEEI